MMSCDLQARKSCSFSELILEDISEWPVASRPPSVARQDQWPVASVLSEMFKYFMNSKLQLAITWLI